MSLFFLRGLGEQRKYLKVTYAQNFKKYWHRDRSVKNENDGDEKWKLEYIIQSNKSLKDYELRTYVGI
jgi:hypothetical protein